MLDYSLIRRHLNETGQTLESLRTPRLNVSNSMREVYHPFRNAMSRNNMNLLFLPCGEDTRRVDFYMVLYNLSQRNDLDTHKRVCSDAQCHATYYNTNNTAVEFVNFKSINAANKQALKEYMLTFPDVKLIPSLYMVTHPMCDVAVYQFPNNKFVVLTNTIDDDFMEAVYAMLWLNHTNSKATPELADALLRKDEATVVAYINSIIDAKVAAIDNVKYEIFTTRLKSVTQGGSRIEAIERNMQQVRNEIERLTTKLVEQYTKRKDLMQRIRIIQTTVEESPVDDLLLMLTKDIIHSVNEDYSDGSSLYFVMNSQLKYWDVEDYKIMRNNRQRGNFLSDYNEDFIGFLDEIFINNTYTIALKTALLLSSYDNDTGHTCRIGQGRTDDEGRWLANPHIHYYNCWGDNADLINRAFDNGDYVTAWGTILSAISAVCMTDTAVMRNFVSTIYDRIRNDAYDANQFIKKDGTAFTAYEAYRDYLNSKNAAPTEAAPVTEPLEIDDDDDDDNDNAWDD